MSIGIGLHCWYCEHGPCNGECEEQARKQRLAKINQQIMPYDSTADTLLHIKRVNELLLMLSKDLLQRAAVHDASKLVDPEKAGFDEVTERLKGLEFGSDAYKSSLEDLKPCLDHHYKHNSHHPQHYAEGVDGMNLGDIVEMFFDWKAAGERTKDGNILKSIEVNKERFKISDQLEAIFKNTAKDYNL